MFPFLELTMVSIIPWTHVELQRAWYLHSICQTLPSPHSCHQYASYMTHSYHVNIAFPQ